MHRTAEVTVGHNGRTIMDLRTVGIATAGVLGVALPIIGGVAWLNSGNDHGERAAGSLMEWHDHNRDGVIDLRPNQPVATDERVHGVIMIDGVLGGGIDPRIYQADANHDALVSVAELRS